MESVHHNKRVRFRLVLDQANRESWWATKQTEVGSRKCFALVDICEMDDRAVISYLSPFVLGIWSSEFEKKICFWI